MQERESLIELNCISFIEARNTLYIDSIKQVGTRDRRTLKMDRNNDTHYGVPSSPARARPSQRQRMIAPIVLELEARRRCFFSVRAP